MRGIHVPGGDQENDALELARALIRARSIAPQDDGAQVLLAERLVQAGFHVERISSSHAAHLWAEFPGSDEAPLFAFAVHTDVVPEGDGDLWSVDPFGAEVKDGHLWGRGAVDMKTQAACALVAVESFLRLHKPAFRLGFFATGDEEALKNSGATALLDYLEDRGEAIDCALVTEPSSDREFGDTVRIGRRGSFHGRLVFSGEQRHSSYPDQGVNPVASAAPALTALRQETWCAGNGFFPPTTFQFTRIHADGGASNTTPGECEVEFNLRFSNELTADEIAARVERIVKASGAPARFTWECNALPVLTAPGAFTELVRDAVEAVAGMRPEPSTGGGTSDARFLIARGTHTVEFGPVGKRCHTVDERIPLEDIGRLVRVYRETLLRFQEHAMAMPRNRRERSGVESQPG